MTVRVDLTWGPNYQIIMMPVVSQPAVLDRLVLLMTEGVLGFVIHMQMPCSSALSRVRGTGGSEVRCVIGAGHSSWLHGSIVGVPGSCRCRSL
jgi:hypothetical protein